MAKKPIKGDPFILDGKAYEFVTVRDHLAVAEAKHGSASVHPAELVWDADRGAWTLEGRVETPPNRPATLTAGPPPARRK